MILTVNIGNTHITIAWLRTRHPAVQRAAAFQPGRNGGRIRHEPAESALLISGCPRADRGRYSGQCGARTDRPGIGCAADVLLCPLPDRWPRPEKRHQAAAGQSGPAGRRTAVRCCGRAGGGTRTAGGHLGRYRHLHHGSQRQTGAGGRCHPAWATALPFRAGAKNRPAAPDRPLRSSFLLDLGQEHLCLLTERFCAGHRRAAGRAGRAFSGRAGPGYPLLYHRQPAPHHPGGLPHAHSVPGVSDHGRPIPHLAEKIGKGNIKIKRSPTP